MSDEQSTIKKRADPGLDDQASPSPIPGVLVVFSSGKPLCSPIPLVDGRLEIERGDGKNPFPRDAHVSRRHARLTWQSGRFSIQDLGSENGTWVNGVPLYSASIVTDAQVMRAGDTVFLLISDLRPYLTGTPQIVDGPVEIPRLVAQCLLNLDPRLRPSASLIETCLLRHRPGNLRELLDEIATAGQVALNKNETEVTEQHLAASAASASVAAQRGEG